MTGNKMCEFGVTPMTQQEMAMQRDSFVMEIKKLLDMNFKDKYVIIEFKDGGMSHKQKSEWTKLEVVLFIGVLGNNMYAAKKNDGSGVVVVVVRLHISDSYVVYLNDVI